jgi:hypothetical protein
MVRSRGSGYLKRYRDRKRGERSAYDNYCGSEVASRFDFREIGGIIVVIERRRRVSVDRFRAKRVVLNVIKVVAGIAAAVFWFVPLATGTQVVLFVGSIVVLLICFAASSSLDDSQRIRLNPGSIPDSLLLSKKSNQSNKRKTATAKPKDPAPTPRNT